MARSARPRRSIYLPLAAILSLATAFAAAGACPTCVPLDDLTGPPHAGYPLGLYPGHTNTPPAAHATLAAAAALDVVPRDAAGVPDNMGLIGFISIGMSNTNQEWSAFEPLEDARLGREPRLITVNCALGGKSAEYIKLSTDAYWDTVAARIATAGLDEDQIQVVWLKEAEGTVADTSFPTHMLVLQSDLGEIVRLLKDKFPNLALCYLASRTYGGYNTIPARSEPLSYETGFAVRGVIEQQILGDPLLNADPGAGTVEAPVLLWGPYLWANGTIPRASDGLTWLSGDFESDFIHPSASGESKVAAMMVHWVATDPTVAPWKDVPVAEVQQVVTPLADAFIDMTLLNQNFGGQPILVWSNTRFRTYTKWDLGAIRGTVYHAKLAFRTVPNVSTQPAEVVVVTNNNWGEFTITGANAPAFDGPVLGTIPPSSRGSAISIDVTSAVQAALAQGPNAQLSIGLRLRQGQQHFNQVGSRESTDSPRLIIASTVAPADVADSASPDAALRPLAHPFMREGTLELRLPVRARLDGVLLYDASGRAVRTLDARPGTGGTLQIYWDGRDDGGAAAPSGIFVARARLVLQDGSSRELSAKFLLLR